MNKLVMPGLTPDGHGHSRSVVNTHCSEQFEYKSHFRAASGLVVKAVVCHTSFSPHSSGYPGD